jgi:hypothetical protein
MKNYKFVWLLSIFAFIYGALNAEISSNFQVNTISKDKTQISFKLPEYTIKQITTESGVYSKIVSKDAVQGIEEGMPDLPVYSITVAVPQNSSNCSFSYEAINNDKLPNVTIYPSQFNQESQKLIKNESYYSKGEIYPQSVIKISEIQTVRDYKIVNISVYPFTYNAKERELSVSSQINIELSHNSSDSNYKSSPKISLAFEPIYKAMIANYDQIRDAYPSYQKPSLLIIYPTNTDASFNTALNSIINWKKQKGFAVTAVNTTATGSSSSNIKNYIQTYYNNALEKPEYLMLIGDVSGTGYAIPTFSEAYGFLSGVPGAGDYPYTFMSGDTDYFGDIILGRLSVSSVAQLQTVASKISLYEKNPTIAGSDWYHENLLVGDTSPSGVSCIITNKYVKELLENYDSNNNYTEIYGGNPSPTEMQNKLSSGVAFFNYRGWIGMSGFTSSNVSSATNVKKLTNAVFITCATGAFSNSSIIEDILRAGTPTEPKGAITAIGMSTSHTLTPFNNVLTSGIFYALLEKDITTMGGAMLFSKYNIHRVYGTSSQDGARTFCQWMNLMGDPTVNAYRSIPKEITVNTIDTLYAGSNYIPVQLYNDDHAPISNAWVSVTDASYNSLGFVLTDMNGKANIYLNNYTTGNVTLVVSHADYKSFTKTIQSASSGIIAVTTFTTDDALNTPSNNEINSGEVIKLSLNIKNNTSTSYNNINVLVKANNPYITMIDSTAVITSLANGATTNLSDEIRFTVHNNYPANCPLDLTVKTTSGTTSFNSLVKPIVKTADMEKINMFEVGSQLLNINQPTQIYFSLANNGTGSLENLHVKLMPVDEKLIVTDSTAVLATSNAGYTVNNVNDPFTVQSGANVLPGETVNAKLVFYTSKFYEEEDITITFAAPATTDPLAPDAYGYTIFENSDSAYEDAPTYEWIEISSTGTALALNDTGDNGDVVTPVTLPFNFKFYGQTFTQISVCSNGWFAGGVTEQAEFRNVGLPGPQAPENLIAPYWNDLYKSGTGSGVYTYNNTAEHYFVIQWNNMKLFSNNQIVKFQAIIYDPSYYAEGNGDGPIKFQYHTFNGGSQNDGSDPETPSNYFTTGIQNGDGTVGLTYAYNNIYSSGASTLASGKALLVKTRSTGSSNHFNTVWNGTPYNPAYVIINSATINNLNLTIGDEIGIFDNQYCVGALKISQNNSYPDTIIVSADQLTTPYADGYTTGNNMLYKLWDNETQTEYNGACIQTYYQNGNGIFTQGLTYNLNLNAAVLGNQTLSLIPGWNKVSINRILSENDMMTIFASQIASNSLIKIINESGATLENVNTIGWINNIGNISNTEGYLVKVNAASEINLNGYPVFLPYDIQLQNGWNVISFPEQVTVNAMTAFQNLINSGTLVKVTDETGNSI